MCYAPLIMLSYHHFRRLLFWTFVLGFFMTASLVLFFAFGYRFNFDRGIFVYSGSVTVKSIPENVSITVDGELLPTQRLGILNNSIHVAGLMPGEHFIEVSAPGYRSWGKKAIVQSGRSTEFWNVLLTEESYAFETIAGSTGSVKAFPEPGGTLIVLVKRSESSTSIVVYDRDTKTSHEVFASASYGFDPASYENIEWSPDGKRLILPLTSDGKIEPMIVTLETGETTLLRDLWRATRIMGVRWDPGERYTLLFLADDNLYRLNLESDRSTELLVGKVKAYDISGSFIYIARLEDGSVLRFRQGTLAETLTQVTLSPPASPSETPASLIVYDNDRLALLERGGERRLFVYNAASKKNYGFQELGSNVSGVQFSNDGKKLLFFSKNEMDVYFTRAWEVQPERQENSTAQIARFSDPIDNIQWTEDYEHVLFNRGKDVKMIELDNRDRRVISDIVTLSVVPTQIVPLFSDNLLFFVQPGIDTASIIFPATQGLFGL